MTTNSHSNCSHAATKSARAKCRRDAAKPTTIEPKPTAAYWADDMEITGHDDDDYDRSGMFSNE